MAQPISFKTRSEVLHELIQQDESDDEEHSNYVRNKDKR